MTRLPREARDGLMRAWLEILRERHPGVTWVARAWEAPNDDLRAWEAPNDDLRNEAVTKLAPASLESVSEQVAALAA